MEKSNRRSFDLIDRADARSTPLRMTADGLLACPPTLAIEKTARMGHGSSVARPLLFSEVRGQRQHQQHQPRTRDQLRSG